MARRYGTLAGAGSSAPIMDARTRFLDYAAGEITNENLALGALIIAAEDYPGLDVDAYLARLDAIAERVKASIPAEAPETLLVDPLHEEFFVKEEFRGDTETYYDPRNAYLNEVIDRKAGLPITLSIAFSHVAARAGLTVSGVGLPGHYIVKARFGLSEIYIDPFRGGEMMTVRELGAVISEMSGGSITLSAEHLRAWNGRETLMRVLSNLHGMWQRAGESRRAASAAERVEILQG